MRLKRRDVLRFGALGVAGGPSAGLLSSCAIPASDVLDVAIIGGGISGLAAGHGLHKVGLKRFAVLEARERVGGRTLNLTVNDQPVESGATWIGPGQTAIYQLCRELGLQVYPSYWDGDHQVLADGKVIRAAGTLGAPIADPGLLAKVEALAKTVPTVAPWRAANASALDQMTFAQYLKQSGMPPEELAVLTVTAATTFGRPADQISLLYALFYFHSAGGYTRLETMKGGAQQDRIRGGSQAVSVTLRQVLGGAVRLANPVIAIRDWHGAGPVKIETTKGLIKARRVIIALSPSQASEIAFSPALPAGRQAILTGWPRDGSGITHHFGYKTPFWRKQGLSGLAVSLLDDGSSILFADMSPEDGSTGILKALGASGTRSGRKDAAQAALVKLFGPEAADPTMIAVQDWSAEKYTRGCVSPMPVGFLGSLNTPLAEPCGALHWAGTETAGAWMGYMDGAVRAGGRSAVEALTSLTSQHRNGA